MALGIKIPKAAFTKGKEALKQGDDFNNVDLDPGKHVCIVTGLRGVETKNGPSAVMDLKVAGESEQAGGKVGIFFSVEEDRIVYLLRALSRLGYDVEDIDDATLEEIAKDIKKSKPVVRVTAKKSGDYTNVYIDKLLEDVSASEVEASSDDAEDSDDEEETDDEDEKPAKKSKKPVKKSDDEDEEEDAEEDSEDEDEDEDEEEEEKPAKKPVKKPAKKDEDEEDDSDDEEDEEDEAPKKKPAKKPAKKDEEEDEDAEEEDPSGDEDEVELEVGMSVKSAGGKWEGAAKVVAIDEAKGIVKVKAKDGTVIKAKPEDIEL